MKAGIKTGTLLWILILALECVGLTGCDKDDENEENLEKYVYRGYIDHLYPGDDTAYIRITGSQYASGRDMPIKGELISFNLSDFPDIDFWDQQPIFFRITSARGLMVPMDRGFGYYCTWHCKITILKIKQ